MAPQDDTFFVFADTSNRTCWHNLHFTRSISSSGVAAAASDPVFREAYLNGTTNYVPFVPNNERSSGFVSLFTVHTTSQYEVEYDAEYVRYREFGMLPSRLSAVYAFGSAEECQKAHDLYGWDLSQVRRFRLVPHPLNRVHRANMQLISLMRSAYPRASWSREERDAIWRHYWSGGGSLKVEIPVIRNDAPAREWFESGEIWEYLIEGRLELIEEGQVSGSVLV
jgi:hypothetical protein